MTAFPSMGVNNCIAEWKLSAWSIQGFSLLAASCWRKCATQPWAPSRKGKNRYLQRGGQTQQKQLPAFWSHDLYPLPSGVWEKHFPLILLHSASRKLPLNAFKIDICVYISGSMTGCHLTGGVLAGLSLAAGGGGFPRLQWTLPPPTFIVK